MSSQDTKTKQEEIRWDIANILYRIKQGRDDFEERPIGIRAIFWKQAEDVMEFIEKRLYGN